MNPGVTKSSFWIWFLKKWRINKNQQCGNIIRQFATITTNAKGLNRWSYLAKQEHSSIIDTTGKRWAPGPYSTHRGSEHFKFYFFLLFRPRFNRYNFVYFFRVSFSLRYLRYQTTTRFVNFFSKSKRMSYLTYKSH